MADASPPDQAVASTVAGNDLRLIPSGSGRLRAILDLIGSAERELRLLYYMFSGDDAGTAVRDALVKAARRGVKVRLLVDGFGCGKIDDDFLEPLREAGGHFCIFHARIGRRYLIRNHQKMTIADGRKALIGGANINDHYLEDEGEERWRDLWLAIEGPAVERLSDYFDSIESWTRRRKPRIRDLRRIITRHSRDDGPVAWRFSGPMRRQNPWPAQIVKDIGNAERLDIVAAYFSPPNSWLWRIAGVVMRGGQARVVTAAKSDNNATIAAARFTYGRLLRRRVKVYEYQPARLHTKLYVTDDAVHIGSSNFDFRSLFLNLEMMLRIEDRAFAEAIRAYIDGEIDKSVEITPSLHKKRASLWRKLKWAASNFLVTTMDYTVTRRINFGLES